MVYRSLKWCPSCPLVVFRNTRDFVWKRKIFTSIMGNPMWTEKWHETSRTTRAARRTTAARCSECTRFNVERHTPPSPSLLACLLPPSSSTRVNHLSSCRPFFHPRRSCAFPSCAFPLFLSSKTNSRHGKWCTWKLPQSDPLQGGLPEPESHPKPSGPGRRQSWSTTSRESCRALDKNLVFASG